VTARSIFQKVCPECMATVPLDTRECSCGHHLDHDDTDTALTSEEIRLKAEELYENYLGARVEQAAKAVKTAQAEFAREPSNPGKSEQVASTIREVQIAKSALATQSAHIAVMKKAMSPTARPAAPSPVATPARKRVTALHAVATKPQARITRKPIPVLTDVVATAPAPVRPKHETKVVAVTSKKLPATAAPSRKPDIAPAVQSARKPEIAPPVQSATPNPAFRQAQAAKAEKILRAKITQPAPVVKAVKEEARMVPVAEPKPPQTTPITAKTAPRLYAPRDKKDCPNCTASVALAAARCRCGYEFPSSEHLIPALAMSDEERAEFAKLFSTP
jgi:hypothetical protein